MADKDNVSFKGMDDFEKRYFAGNPAAIRDFLNVALEDYIENGDKAEFLNCVAMAVKWAGASSIASKGRISRQGIYKAIKPASNPAFTTIVDILHGAGFSFKITKA